MIKFKSYITASVFGSAFMLLTSCAQFGGGKSSLPSPSDLNLFGPTFDDSYQGDLTTGVKAFKNREYSKALHELYLSAKDGKPEAQYYLGLMYARGLGVRQSQDKSLDWLESAASKNYLDAMLAMAQFYRDGIYYGKNDNKAFKWYKRAAKKGSAEAQFVLARSFLAGDFGVKQNSQQAYRWMQESADQKYGAAENGLGMLYYTGQGVIQDYEKALKLIRLAVAKGEPAASYNLARFYLDSATGYYNPVEAHALMEQAAMTGFEPAINAMGRLQRELEAYKNTISLFGLPLGLTNRQEMRERLRNLDTKLLVEVDDIWVDTYDSTELMKDSDRLYIGYSLLQGKVGTVKYRFPQMNTPEGVSNIFNKLYKRYGDPLTSKSSQFDVDGVYYTWKVNGVHIQLVEGWPSESLFVRYEVDAVYPQMRAEQKQQTSSSGDDGLPINLM